MEYIEELTKKDIEDIKSNILSISYKFSKIDKGSVDADLQEFDKTTNNFYAKALLSKILTQYVALTYDGKPDYEIHTDENKNTNDITQLFDDNYKDVDSTLKKVVKDYFLYGYGCILLESKDGSLSRVKPELVFTIEDNNNIFAIETELGENEASFISKEYDIAIPDNARVKYVYYNEENSDYGYRFLYIDGDKESVESLYFISETSNTKKNCILESDDYSELYKISHYLKSYQSISENYKNAIPLIKLIALVEPSLVAKFQKLMKQDFIVASTPSPRQADLELARQLEWLNNAPIAQTMEIIKVIQETLESKIHEILGFSDVYGAQALEDSEETRVGATHRVSANLALWKLKQNNILIFMDIVLSKWISYLSKQDARINLGATNLLEKDRKEQIKQGAITTLLGIVEKAVMPNNSPLLINFYKKAGLALISNAVIPQEINDEFEELLDSISNMAQQNSQQAGSIAQMSTQLELQAKGLKLEDMKADTLKKQTEAQKNQATIQEIVVQTQLAPQVVASKAQEAEAKVVNAQRNSDAEERIETQKGIHVENGQPVEAQNEEIQKPSFLSRLKQLFLGKRGN